MKILCCFKIVPDLEMLPEQEWYKASITNNVDTSLVRNVWNCFDESALEMTLKLSDKSEGFNVISEINALTIGANKCDSYLKLLYALGYNKAIRINASKEEINFKPKTIAYAIYDYIYNFGKEDVIITGMASADCNNKKVPFYLAELLNIPCISQVIDFTIIDEKTLKVISCINDIEYTYLVKKPCLLSIGNVACTYLRVPTLKNRMNVRHKKIIKYELKELLQDKYNLTEYMELKNLHLENKLRNGEKINGENLTNKIDILFERLKNRL